MSFSEIKVRFTLPIINGFVQPADGQKKYSTRVTPKEAMDAIPGARVINYRTGAIYTDSDNVDFDYSSMHDKLVLELPEIEAGQSYGSGQDHHQTIRDLGL